MAIPVTLQDARRQVKLEADDTSQDDDLTTFLADAVGWVETYTGQILSARDVTETVRGCFGVELRAWPIKPTAVASVSYTDDAGATVAVVGVRVDVTRRPARILPAVGSVWTVPSTRTPVTVTIRAGYEDNEPIPRNMRRAILILVSAYDLDREGGDTFAKAEAAARLLCSSFRTRRV